MLHSKHDLSKAAQQQPDAAASMYTQQFEINKQASILVIDDNHFNLVAAKLLLSEFGVSCDIAISGKKGIRLYK